MNFNINENIELLFQKFEKFLKEKTVIGEPIQMGNITMIPTMTVSFGLGSGGGDGTDNKGNGGNGSGGGIGARIVPTAMIVVKGEDVQILPIKKTGVFDKLVEMVPEIVDKIKDIAPNNQKLNQE